MKNEEFGRSMIEMLGVLAIVGILSVGGISGFSKAMMKHRHIKFREEYEQLIQNVMQYKKDWLLQRRRAYPDNKTDFQYGIADLIKKCLLLPDNWSVEGAYIYDTYSGKHYINARNQRIEFQYRLNFSENGNNEEMQQRCQMVMLEIIKPHEEDVRNVTLWKGNTKFGDTIYGNNYCNSNRICLKDMQINEIVDYCKTCIKNKSECGIVYSME